MAWFMAHPSDIIGAFHYPRTIPSLCFLCTDFPPSLPSTSGADLWCETFLPPSLWNLSQPSQSSLDALTCENNFCGAIVCSVVLNNPWGWGEGLSCHTGRCPRVQNQWLSGNSCLGLSLLSWLFFTLSRRDIFSGQWFRVQTPACLGQPRFWECCCVNTHRDTC